MLITKLHKMLLAVVIVMISQNTYANTTFKKLVLEALKDGQSEGIVTDNIAEMYKAGTKSNEPLHIKIKKIENYANGCGRLDIDFKQAGIKDINGKPDTTVPNLKISMCPNGQPPKETVQIEKQRRTAVINSCTAAITVGSKDKDTGATNGTMKAKGCPPEGNLSWKYNGSCQALKMPGDMVTTFPVDKEGNMEFKMSIPVQCKNRNSWVAFIHEKQGTLIGHFGILWPGDDVSKN